MLYRLELQCMPLGSTRAFSDCIVETLSETVYLGVQIGWIHGNDTTSHCCFV